jgi:CCR4-NOT transcriptional complex subunit CAF120
VCSLSQHHRQTSRPIPGLLIYSIWLEAAVGAWPLQPYSRAVNGAGSRADWCFHVIVSSFLSTWSHPTPHSHHQKHDSTASAQGQPPSQEAPQPWNNTTPSTATATNVSSPLSNNVHDLHDFNNNSSPAATPPRTRTTSGSRPSSRPASMVQTYQPPLMEVANDTPPELQPVFTFLNSHSNKLYQEGYFLKLHDLDSRGRPSSDRTWQECFAV